MVKDIFTPNSPLTKLERKYCTCLLDVRDKSKGKVNPYAVCTKSIYTTRGLTRHKQVGCDYNYNYDSMNQKSLFQLAKEKKLTKGKAQKKLTKKMLSNKLSGRVQKLRTQKYKKIKNKLDLLQKN
jgi:hypothetical protein